eukprot:218283_1
MMIYLQIVFVLSLINGQSIPQLSLDKLCVSRSLISSEIDGEYEYFYWDSSLNASMYYNSKTDTYLYPSVDSNNNKEYLISTTDINSSINSICSLNQNDAFNPYNCFNNWHSYINDTLIPDPNMRLVNCNDICLTGNDNTWLDGTYVWLVFDLARRGSIYYCEQCVFNTGAYLFGWILVDSNGNIFLWMIGPDPTTNSAWSACNMGNLGSNYLFNLDDCPISSWHTYAGEAWVLDAIMPIKCYPTSNPTNQPTSDPTKQPSPINEDDQICASGSLISSNNGPYEYFNGSIYYNPQTRNYLYPWNLTSSRYQIGSSISSQTMSYCVAQDMSTPYNCYTNWVSLINNTWTSDSDMRLVNCNDICVTGGNKTWINGRYIWNHFNRTHNTSIFHCKECGVNSGTYLFGWIFSDGTHAWRIGSNYKTSSGWNSCRLGNDLGPNYIFNLADCGYWATTDSVGWKTDTNIKVKKCNKSISVTNAPTFSPSSNYDSCVHQQTYVTPLYGGFSGSQHEVINHDQINGVKSWSVQNAITNVMFDGINQTFGNGSGSECSAFTLEDDDYINGYRVIYEEYVYGLFFHTMKGNSYGCVDNKSLLHKYNDTSDIYYNNTYLSGFYVKSSDVISSISFQFTSFIDCPDICISGMHKTYLDGTYTWNHFDETRNSSIYYCNKCTFGAGTYLFGWILPDSYIWALGYNHTHPILDYTWTFCYMNDNLGPNYIFDLDDCLLWVEIINGSKWNIEVDALVEKCYPTPQPTFNSHHNNYTMIEEDKLCVSGSDNPSINGEYDKVNDSAYYNNNTGYYLHQAWNFTSLVYQYHISDKSSLQSYCVIDDTKDKYTFNPEYCFKDWITKLNNTWIHDSGMRLVNCNDICITRNDVLYLNGRYIWNHFNHTMGSSIYYCKECHDTYLYVDSRYSAVLSPQVIWINPPVFSYCHLDPNSQPPDVEKCSPWATHHVTDQEWHVELDMHVEKCNAEDIFPPIQSNYNECGIDTIKETPYYGRDDGAQFEVTNQDTIKGIKSWRVQNNSGSLQHAITNLRFDGIDQTFGSASGNACPSFILDDDDYINGFRVIYKQYVYGLIFHTMKGNSYECIGNKSLLHKYNDTGDIYYDNKYLSGFYVKSSDVINSISFQFTPLVTCKYIVFGFETPTSQKRDITWITFDSGYTMVTMTLYWEGSKYQCKVKPNESGKYFSCNTLDITRTLQCDTGTTAATNPVEYGLQLDNKYLATVNGFEIDRVIIKYIENDMVQNIWVFDYFCFNTRIGIDITFEYDPETFSPVINHCLNALNGYDILMLASDWNNLYLYNLIVFNDIQLNETYLKDGLDAYVYNHSSSPECVPDGYYQCTTLLNFTNVHGKCEYFDKYILISSQKTWNEAEKYCEEEFNSNLATITSKEELNIVVTMREMNSTYFDGDIWIGLYEDPLSGAWRWIDGTTCDYVENGLCKDNNLWADTEPAWEHDCAVIDGASVHGSFASGSCGFSQSGFLCNNPIYIPTNNPTISPSNYPTTIIIKDKVIFANNNNYLWYIAISAVIALLICIFVMYCRWQYMNAFVVNKAVVLIIGIAEFMDEKHSFLPGVKQNVSDLIELWRDEYKYDVFVCNNEDLNKVANNFELKCTKREVIRFIDVHKSKLKDNSYNCVIVHIISHGWEDSFISSDLKTISNEFIRHELITTAELEENLELMKIIFHHSCRGDADYSIGEIVYVPVTQESENIEKRKEHQTRAMFDINFSVNNNNDNKISHHSNCVTISGNIVGRSLSDSGHFTKCICNSFKNNLRRVAKANFTSLIAEIGRNLEHITKNAELCNTNGTLRYNPIRFEKCKSTASKVSNVETHIELQQINNVK